MSYVKRSSTYSIPQELQQLCVYSEVYFVVRTLCLNTDTICIVGKVDSCPCPRTHQASQYTESLKNLKIWTPQWPVSEKSLTCCDILNQHIVITVGGSLIPLFYYLYTLYIFRAFSSETPQRQVVVTTQKSHSSCLQIWSPTHGGFSWMFPLLPKHRWTSRDYKKCISLIQKPRWSREGWGWVFFPGGGQFSRVQWLGGRTGQRRVP